MVRRLAIVVWWFGAAWFAGAVAGLLGGFIAGDPGQRVSMGLFIAALCTCCGLASWTLAFILGGTFHRPPAV